MFRIFENFIQSLQLKVITIYEKLNNIQIWAKRVRDTCITWNGTQYQSSKLCAVCRNDVTERKVVVAQKLGKIFQQN